MKERDQALKERDQAYLILKQMINSTSKLREYLKFIYYTTYTTTAN